MLSEKDGKELIELAKKSIISSFSHETIELEHYKNKYSQERGCFVTLKKNGELRGCIGFPLPIYKLYDAVFKAARAAAFDDSRFLAVDKDEIHHLEIELSVLSVPKKIEVDSPEEYLKKIEVGRDGLIIKYQMHSGLLLPQVPIEWKWDALQYLENLCQKAGLPSNAWKEEGVEIESFQAQVFN